MRVGASLSIYYFFWEQFFKLFARFNLSYSVSMLGAKEFGVESDRPL
jgi:hypothetical protein